MKDAKGHGSDARGGGQPTGNASPMSRAYQAALGKAQGRGVAHQAGVSAVGQPGISLRATASENPKSPKADQQDFQERVYRYNGTNSKAAVNWALKKVQGEFPDHRRHEVEVMS